MYKILSLIIGCFTSIICFCQTDSTLKEFAGKYTFPAGSVLSEVSIVYENGSLTVNTVMGSSALVKKEGDIFSISQYNGTATFTRDANKKVNGITIDALGYHLEGTKENSIALYNIKMHYNYSTFKFYKI
ncbi:MAG: hypothetical protein ACOVMM_11555 [Chitinophagaceae bacterium]